jgi:hypothetical protein
MNIEDRLMELTDYFCGDCPNQPCDEPCAVLGEAVTDLSEAAVIAGEGELS